MPLHSPDEMQPKAHVPTDALDHAGTPETTYNIHTAPLDEAARREADLHEQEHARNVAEYRDMRPLIRTDDKTSRDSKYPRSAYEAANIPYDKHLEPELIEFDRQIPLIATPGSDRRRSRPDWNFRDKGANTGTTPSSTPLAEHTAHVLPFTPEHEPAHATLNESREVRAVSADKTADIAVEPPPEPPRASNSVLGLDAPPSRTQVVTAAPVAETTIVSESRNNFFDLSERKRDNTSSLHGPSFLGLNTDSDVQYLEDDEHKSHVGAYLALVLLLVLIGLGAWQWRRVRDFGMKYASVLHLPGKDQVAVTAPPTNSAEPAPGSTTTPATNGQPEIVTEPTKSAAAASQGTAASQNSASQPGSAAPTQPANSAAGNNASTPPPTNKDGKTEIASNLPQGEPREEDADNADAANAGDESNAAAATPTKREARSPKETARVEPGQAELAQASAAADPASAASWLWKAVGKGSADAQVRLADMYIDGRGVPQNCDQALILLRSASGKKFSRARIRMGSLYATGKCVQQDRVAAYHWMTLALDSSPGSQWVEENRQSLWSQMSEEERRRAGGRF